MTKTRKKKQFEMNAQWHSARIYVLMVAEALRSRPHSEAPKFVRVVNGNNSISHLRTATVHRTLILDYRTKSNNNTSFMIRQYKPSLVHGIYGTISLVCFRNGCAR